LQKQERSLATITKAGHSLIKV